MGCKIRDFRVTCTSVSRALISWDYARIFAPGCSMRDGIDETITECQVDKSMVSKTFTIRNPCVDYATV